jgi:hypothetical protein
MRTKRSAWSHVCDIRKMCGLGCKGCVLSGTVECSKLGGGGKRAPNLDTVVKGTYGGRDVAGYSCNIPLDGTI